MSSRFSRPPIRRAVVLLPNGFTLANLFCGIYAIVLSSRGAFSTATLFILLGGVADALDGRVARATGTGSRMGEELDSLVDAISFGFAPAMIMYFAVLNRGNWDWIFVFLFTACAVMRLARFNVEQAGRSKTHFHGLPSPAAGMTLATYYWFSQTPLYNETFILFTSHTTLADLQWHTIMIFVMAGLAFLMVSDVPYPAVPRIGVRNVRQVIGTLIVAGGVVALIFLPREFFFPVLVVYVLFGALKSAIEGLIDRDDEPNPEDVYWQPDPDAEDAPALAVAAQFRHERGRSSKPTGVPTPHDGFATSQRKRRRRRRSGGTDTSLPNDRSSGPTSQPPHASPPDRSKAE